MRRNALSPRAAAITVWITLNLLTGCSSFSRPSTAEVSARESLVNPEQEYHFGRAISAHILKQYPLIRDSKSLQYLNAVGITLAIKSSRPVTFNGYRFGLVSADAPLAFSTPGGFVFLSTGLVALLESEDELAAVLAHEISHVSKQHGLAAILEHDRLSKNNNNIPLGCDELASLAALAFQESVQRYLGILLENGFNSDQEFEADDSATEMLLASGYTPQALEAVLERLAQLTSSPSSLFQWRRTHPEAAERARRLSARNAARGRTIADTKKRLSRFKDWKKQVKNSASSKAAKFGVASVATTSTNH